MSRVAVVDVGTNSVRLLVADVSGARVRDVARELVITRLGEGVDGARALAAEPMRRTVDAIADYAARADALGAEEIRIVATSAARDAANRDDFVAAVRAATGNVVEVISGEEEARLGFLGATLDLGAPGPYLVVDVGGGSTELVAGEREVTGAISLDIGSVRLNERHIRSDPPDADEVAALAADAAAQVARAREILGAPSGGTLLGLAGTITTVAAVALGLRAYDRAAVHHARLSGETIAGIRARMCAMTSAQRRALPAMPRGREDVIVGGVVILEAVMTAFGAAACVVSESDLLDGAAVVLAGRRGAAHLPRG